MSRTGFIVRDGDGAVIGQYIDTREPKKPDEYTGDWLVEKVNVTEFNNEPVDWWDVS